jgi:uncharacterized protein YbbK (DUF523 family)
VDDIQKNAFKAPDIPAPPGPPDVPDRADSPPSGAPSDPLVLVSACLAGRHCRFDAGHNKDDLVGRLVASGRAVLVCPEVDGGLPTPRPPAEIVGGDGHDVLAGKAQVVTGEGTDVTEAYLAGAYRALRVAQAEGVTRAVLKARSPSCGSGAIYDGSHTRTLVEGSGVTAALLEANGIEVVTEDDV